MDRKVGCVCGLIIIMTMRCLNVWAQQNLVPNPSFEDYTDCPSNSGEIYRASNWLGIKGSVDYFNSCGVNGYSVPYNAIGNQHAYDGVGYFGIVPWAWGINNAREYAGSELLEALIEGRKYHFAMYVSLADTVGYAVRKLDAALTISQPTNNQSILFGLTQRIGIGDSTFIENQSDWVLLKGEYVALGGENYLTIGNFLTDLETDTLRVSSVGTGSSYYYIDNVSLVEDTTYHVGMEETETSQFVLWPNPTTDVLNIEVDAQKENSFELLDVRGRTVMQQMVQNQKHQVDVSHLPTGVYVAVLRQKGIAVARRRVVIQR